MIFSPDQIQELKSILDRYVMTFIATNIGISTLSKGEISALTAMGIDPSDILDAQSNVTQAFKFGLLSDAVGNDVAKRMSYDKFKSYLSSGRFIPLNAFEEAALESLKYQAAAATRVNADSIKKDLDDALVHIEKGKAAIHSKKVLNAAQKVIEDRKGVAQLRSMLGEMTGQWDRNLGRMSNYVLHEAFNYGRLASAQRGGNLVYFDVYPGACKHCIRLYLTGGVGTEPKVFTVDQLINNGSNVGLKVKDWKAVIAGAHPNCRCTINNVPEGYEWNDETKAFDKPKFKRKVKRRSKVAVKVNGKTVEI